MGLFKKKRDKVSGPVDTESVASSAFQVPHKMFQPNPSPVSFYDPTGQGYPQSQMGYWNSEENSSRQEYGDEPSDSVSQYVPSEMYSASQYSQSEHGHGGANASVVAPNTINHPYSQPPNASMYTSSVPPDATQSGPASIAHSQYSSYPPSQPHQGMPMMNQHPMFAHPQQQPPHQMQRQSWDPEQSIESERLGNPQFIQQFMPQQNQYQGYALQQQGIPANLCIACGGPSGSFCQQCNASYCDRCNYDPQLSGIAHATKHIGKAKGPGENSCPQHDTDIDVYCRDCDESLCPQCVVFGKHKRHDIVPIQQMYSETMGVVRGKIQQLSQIHKEMRFFEDKLNRTAGDYQQAVARTVSQIKAQVEQMKDGLERQERKLASHVCETANSRERVMVDQANKLRQDIKSIGQLYQAVQTLCQTPSQMTLLLEYAKISQQLQEFEQDRSTVELEQHQLDMVLSTTAVMQEILRLSLKTVYDPIELRYGSDLDTNGLFYYLGTRGNSSFQSPVSNKLVEVTASKWHVGSDAYAPASCWQANIGWLVTENVFGSYICFSLCDEYQIIPRHYRIQNGSQAKVAENNPLMHVLRNWRFEGSQNKIDWDVLSHHHDDNSLGEQVHASASWPLQASRPYQHLRIITSGRNSTRQFYTHFGSIEVWGTLLRQAGDMELVEGSSMALIQQQRREEQGSQSTLHRTMSQGQM